jgi:hypothetical protein
MALLTAFFFISVYFCWKVESKYNGLRDKITQSKSLKDEQIEKENEYITSYLAQNEFQPVPIPKEVETKDIYKFEEEGVLFDTREDFLEGVAKDHAEGKNIGQTLEEELKKKGLI